MSSNQGVVRLHRKSNALMPTGTFRCEILDSNRTRQNIYVQVYYESMSSSSFPDYTVETVVSETGVSGAVLGGAAAGGTLLTLIIIAGILLALMFAIRR